MSLTLHQEVTIGDEDIKEAICLLCSPRFGVLNLCNALAGYQSTAWKLIRETKPLSRIFREAQERKLDLSALQCAVEGGPVLESPTFKRFMEKGEV